LVKDATDNFSHLAADLVVCSIWAHPVQEANEEAKVLYGFGFWEVEPVSLRILGLFEQLEAEDAARRNSIADNL